LTASRHALDRPPWPTPKRCLRSRPTTASGLTTRISPGNTGAGGSFVEYDGPVNGGGNNGGNVGDDGSVSTPGDSVNGDDSGAYSGAIAAPPEGLSEDDKIVVGVVVGVGCAILLVAVLLTWWFQWCASPSPLPRLSRSAGTANSPLSSDQELRQTAYLRNNSKHANEVRIPVLRTMTSAVAYPTSSPAHGGTLALSLVS
jgi:hypothetical protein